MRIAKVHLSSVPGVAYSTSRMIDIEKFPKKEKEDAGGYDKRLWREKATYTPDGIICIPSMALKQAVDEAIKRLNIGIAGRGKSTYTKFFVAGQICAHDVPLGIHKDDLEYVDIIANSDGIRGSGKRVNRRFPVVYNWKGVAEFHILDDVIPNEVFEKGITEAGRLVGIGRFRPEKGGFNGRFEVDRIDWQTI